MLEDLKALEAEGLKAGLTQAEMDKMSLSELQKAVDKAKNKTEIEKTIADIKVLNPDATGSNGTALSDMTLDELKALLSALQQERATLEASAKAAGMTADEIKKYPSNAALQQAINGKQKAQREDLIKQIQKYDPSYDGSNKTLEQLVADLKAKQEAEQQKQNLINEIKTYDSNYDGTGKTLEQLQSDLAAAKEKKQRTDLIAEIRKYDPSYTGDGKSLSELQADLDAKKAANEEQQQKDALIAEIKKLKSDYNGEGKTLDELRADLAALQQQSSGGEGQTPASESGETPTP